MTSREQQVAQFPAGRPSAFRVAISDTDVAMRHTLRDILGALADVQIVADGPDGGAAVELARRMQPDILTLDPADEADEPARVLADIRSVAPDTRVVIVTNLNNPSLVRDLIGAGAAGYVLKSGSPSELAAALRSAMSNEDNVLVAISRSALVGLVSGSVGPRTTLSPREVEVMRQLAEAKSNRDIGRELHISDATVKRHLSNIYGKLGARSRLDALVVARRAGLIAD